MAFICGYGTLKNKQRSNFKQESHALTETTLLSENNLNTTKTTEQRDSAGFIYSVWIKPKGSFNYSETEGFKSKAEYILKQGKRASRQQTWLQEKIEQETKLVQQRKSTEKKKALTMQKTWSKWLYVVLVITLVWLFYGLRK